MSLFGNLNTNVEKKTSGGGLFSEGVNTDITKKPETSGGGGLFSGGVNLNSTNKTSGLTGLFSTSGTIQKTEEKTETQPKPKNNPVGGLFSSITPSTTTQNPQAKTGGGLFGSLGSGGGNKQNNSGSLFNFQKKINPSEDKEKGIFIDFECDVPSLDRTIEIKVYEETLAADLLRHIILEELDEMTEKDLDEFQLHFEGKPVSFYQKISDFDFDHKSRFGLQKIGLPLEIDNSSESNPPTLTKEGYETTPNLEKLKNMKNSELASVRFSIKNQYAKIDFKERCDLRGVNLDDIFDFEHAFVKVYAGSTAKPMKGYGFNKEAVVTFLNFGVPKDDEKFQEFELKTMKMVNKKDAYFIELDKENDCLVFKVLYF